MRRLVPLSEEIEHQRHDKHQRERRQKARQPEPEGRRADAEQHRPQREQRQVLCRVIAQLRERLAEWLHFVGATATHLMLLPLASSRTATATSPRPIQIAHQSSWRNNCDPGFTSQGLAPIFYEFCHGSSRFLSSARKGGLSFNAPRRTLL